MIRRCSYGGTTTSGTLTRRTANDVILSFEWSGLLNQLYTEARVIAMRVHFAVPASQTTFGYVLAGTDRSGALAVATLASQVFALQNAKLWNFPSGNKESISYEAKALDLEDQNFSAVSSMASSFAIQWLNSTNSSIATFTEFLVEFRGNQ